MSSWGAEDVEEGDFEAAIADLRDGNWVGGSVHGLEAGLGLMEYIDNPFGGLFSAGIGFVLENFKPFPDWLDDLCGDPGAIRTMVDSWSSVSRAVADNRAETGRIIDRDLAEWDGLAAVAFRGVSRASQDFIDICARAAAAVSIAVELAGAVVAGVRDFVSETVSDLVGYAVGKAVELLSIVFAGHAVASIIAKVARTAERIRGFIDDLIDSIDRLSTLLNTVKENWEQLKHHAELLDTLPGKIATEILDLAPQ